MTTSANQPTPMTTSANQTTPMTTSANQTTPMTTSANQPTPMTTSGNQPTPMTTSGNQPTPMTTSANQPTPMTTSANQTTPMTTSANQPTPMTTSGNQPTPMTTSGNQPTPMTTSGNQPTPMTTSGNQPTPMTTSANQTTPMTTSANQPTPMTTSANQPTPVTTSGNQPTPMTTIITTQNSSSNFSTPNPSITSSGTTLLPFNGSNGTVLNWAGYQWNVGNNPDAIFGNESFSSNNVWVDSVGYLHLKLSYDSTKNQWWCAEVSSQTNFSFGILIFYVDGQIDQLDPNVVFSIFTYNEVIVRPEIVMEFSTFDRQEGFEAPNLWYKVFPDNVNTDYVTVFKQITLNENYTTQRMDWKTDSLILQSQYNFTQNASSQVFCQFNLDRVPIVSVPQQASPVHLSVWLDGNAPIDGQEVEIIVQNFFYTSY